MKNRHKKLISTITLTLLFSGILTAPDTSPIPKIKQIADLSITQGDYVKFPIGGYIGGTNTKYSISEKHSSGTTNKGINLIQRLFDSGTLRMKDTVASSCTIATRISDDKFFVLCNKLNVHFIQFKEDPKTNKKTLIADNCWSRKITNDPTEDIKIEKCYDMIEFESYAIVVCKRTPEDSKPNSLYFAFVSRDKTFVSIQAQTKEQFYQDHLKLAFVKSSSTTENNHLILRQRFPKTESGVLYRSFKIWNIKYVNSQYTLDSQGFIDISKLKETALAASKEIGSTLDVRNIEFDGTHMWISGTDYIAPPKPPSLEENLKDGSTPHNVIKAFRFTFSRNGNDYSMTPSHKGYLIIPFMKDEKIEKCSIRFTPIQGASSQNTITVVTKTRFLQGEYRITPGKETSDPDIVEFIEKKKSEFLCGSDSKNPDKDNISDIQISRDGRGLLIALHHFDSKDQDQTESLGILNTDTFVYDCVDNSGKNGYEVLTDYNTLILGNDNKMNFVDVGDSPYIWFNYQGLSQNGNFAKGAPTEVTLTATNKITNLVDRKGEIKFNITLYDEWNKAAIALNPKISEVVAYENTWVKLPYTPAVIRANAAEYSLKVGETEVKDQTKVRINHFNKDEIKIELEGLIGLPDEILNADDNTFVAVKYTKGQKGKFWVFDCDFDKNTPNKFECAKGKNYYELETPDDYIKFVTKIDKFIMIVSAPKKDGTQFTIFFVDDEKKILNQKTYRINGYIGNQLTFTNKGYGYLIYAENSGNAGTSIIQNYASLISRKFYIDSSGNPRIENPITILTQASLCIQDIYYDSENTPDKYRTITVKSHCNGELPKIVKFRLADNLNTETGWSLIKQKEIKSAGFSFCPAGKEGFLFSKLARSLKTFSWEDDSIFDYNLYNIGITEPILMNCISEKDIVQIIGKDSTGNYMMATFKGGRLADPSGRIHSLTKLDSIQSTNKINGIASAWSSFTDRITTLVSYTGEQKTDAKRYAYHFHIEGPEVYYNVQRPGTYSLTLEAKSPSGSIVKSILGVNSVERNDKIKLEVKGKLDKIDKKINLDQHMKLTGHIVGGKLTGPSDIIDKKISLSNRRKMPKHGFKQGTGKVYDQLEVKGKWMMGVVNGKSLNFFYNPTQENGGSTDVSEIKSFDLNVQKAILVQHPTEFTENLAVVKVLDLELKKIDFVFFRLYLDGVTKKAQTSRYTRQIASYGSHANSEFDVIYISQKELYLVELGPGGKGFTLKKLKAVDPSSYGFEEITDKEFSSSTSLITDHQVKSFSTIWLRNYFIVVFTSEGVDTLGLIIYTRGSTPSIHRTTVHDKEMFLPQDIKCSVDDPVGSSFTCFIDAVGDKEVLIKYNLNDVIEGNGLIKSKEKLATFLSPPGFVAVKIQRTKLLTGILYKNTGVKKTQNLRKEGNNRLLNNENLKAAKSIYECEYIVSVYKPGSEYSYITFTCDDFGSPELGTKVDFALETYDADYVWLSQFSKVSSSDSRILQTTPSPIKAFNIGQYEISIPDSNGINWSDIKFEAIGNDGNSNDGSKTIKDFLDGEKKNGSGGSNWWIWLIVILLGVLIIVVIVWVIYNKKRGGEEQMPGSYIMVDKSGEIAEIDDSDL